jgi:hypothetical protein
VPGPDPIPSRWRVVVVRLPTDGAKRILSFLPKGRSVRREDLPIVAAITTDEESAHRTADQLRARGAGIIVAAEPDDPRRTAFCTTHPALVASLACHRCGIPMCYQCMVRAEGEALCDRCLQKSRATATTTRTRQLFAVFVFTVFLYQVGASFRDDRNLVSPYGPVRIVIAQFVEGVKPDPWIVKALNGEPVRGYDGPSLKDLATWFDEEHRRYTHSSFPYAQITVRGPWLEHVEPPDIGAAPWWRVGVDSFRYVRYFEDLSRDHGIDPGDFGVRTSVVFTVGDGDLASHSRGSEEARLAVAYVALDEANPAYALASVAHEICHALGARDLYEPETMLPSYPEGFMEPFQKPLYPQRFAEIMAVDLPVGRGQEKEIRSLDELRIGYRTAADLGWIAEEEADRFYQPPEVQPEDLLDEGELLP